jgi:predicted ATPase/DNA-binding SARP family transcriptional activator
VPTTVPPSHVASRVGVADVRAQLTPLPPQLTQFVGRELEVAEIRRILSTTRLVTLTGIGGSGKTRLAVEVAGRSAGEWGGAITWVDLAPLSDPTLLARHVAAAMGLGESLERSPLATIVQTLCPLSVLLVLDNCEHLVAESAELVHALLTGCPTIRILATSREALGVDGEIAWIVPPLSLPASPDPVTADGIAHSEAVQLFVSRARALQPAYRLTDTNAPSIARVCKQLDGIPLAIELAAARLNVLPVEQIARRLDDVFGLLTTRSRTAPARHRTLRDAIDWSHELLDENEQRLFRRLAVFVGGFTLDAAEAICAGDGITEHEVLDLLSALVDKSLVRAEAFQDEARCSLLEPVRQYAAEKLADSGERDALRERHARHFTEIAERAEPETRGGGRVSPWMTRLERDHGNLRAVSEWCSEDPRRVEIQLRMKAALVWFHFTQGLFREPRECLVDGLAKAGSHVPPLVAGRAYTALGFSAIWQGDFGAAAEPLGRAVEILRGESDPAALSFALIGLGAVVGLAGDSAAADDMLDQAQATLGTRESVEAYGFPYVLLYALASYWRGIVAQVAGNLPKARAALEVCVDTARARSDHPTIAHPLSALARVLTLTGEFEAARRCLAEALPIHARHDDRWGLADALEGAALLAGAEGAPARAARLIGASDGLRDSTGISLPPHLQAGRGALVGSIQAKTGEAEFRAAHAAGRGMTLQETIAAALGTTRVSPPAREPTPPAPQPVSAPTVEPGLDADLRVLALGPLQICRRGKPLEPGDWGSAKPRELLLFLLCQPEGVTREQVGLALWPESTSERVSNSFHVTLHRLRKALGEAAWITKTNERYCVAPDVRCVFDAAVFEREVEDALANLRAGKDALERLRVALTWYRGPFLEDEVVGDWHLDARDRLARIHQDGAFALGETLSAAGRHAEAADAYRRIIAQDDLHEPAYRQLMLSLARSGDRSQALRLYQRLATLLEKELETSPEPATIAVREEIKAAER